MIYVSYLVGVAPKHRFYRIFQRWGRPPLKFFGLRLFHDQFFVITFEYFHFCN